jgi:predicted dehydrogenase
VNRIVRWGVVGPGRIAAKVAGDFARVDGAELLAVASSSPERASAFAAKHGVPRAYGSHAELLADADVDVVYVATLHPQHHAIALAALRAGKALLVEKPFTATVAGAAEIVELARETRRFVMEAMWTRFQPAIGKVRSLIADGAIGEVRALSADLGIRPPFDPASRFFDPRQGGGAMLDLGVYLVSFAQMLLGTPSELSVQGSLTGTGVDAEAALILGFPGGRRATLTMSLLTQTPGQARILGTGGFIDVLPRFHHPKDIVLHREGVEPEPFTLPPLGGGYSHELIEVTEAIRAGRLESAVMPLADTLAVQRVLNEACERLGVFHAESA